MFWGNSPGALFSTKTQNLQSLWYLSLKRKPEVRLTSSSLSWMEIGCGKMWIKIMKSHENWWLLQEWGILSYILIFSFWYWNCKSCSNMTITFTGLIFICKSWCQTHVSLSNFKWIDTIFTHICGRFASIRTASAAKLLSYRFLCILDICIIDIGPPIFVCTFCSVHPIVCRLSRWHCSYIVEQGFWQWRLLAPIVGVDVGWLVSLQVLIVFCYCRMYSSFASRWLARHPLKTLGQRWAPSFDDQIAIESYSIDWLYVDGKHYSFEIRTKLNQTGLCIIVSTSCKIVVKL